MMDSQLDDVEVYSEEKPFLPSYSYGCARTSGVAVVYKPQKKKQKRQSKAVPKSEGEPCESSQKHSKLPAVPRDKDVSKKQQVSGRTKKRTVNKIQNTKAIKAKRKPRNFVEESTGKASQKKKETKGNGRFLCGECGEVFSFRGNLLRHHELHFASLNDYRCNLCGKTFAVKRNLARHLKVHAPVDPNDRPYSCDKCDKSFHRAKYLYHHQKVHDTARPYACQFCVKTFKTSFNLQCHEAIHLNCKPYVCQFCGMAFIRSSHRTIHERIHTNERPFKCDACDKAFIRGDHLRSHQKVHRKK